MKKVLALLLVVCMLVGFNACSMAATTNIMPSVLNTTEYALYMNIFYNKAGDQFVGQTLIKEGVFTTIHDSYSNCTRYYVWGYNDQTKCCDWQWEFVPKDPSQLPTRGSQVTMTGTFAKSDKALDGYWFEDATISTEFEYVNQEEAMALTTMSDTLERVQLININRFPQNYEGQTIAAYGRIASETTIQDPYYSGSWTQAFSSTDPLPAIGTMVVLKGVLKEGVITECTITPTTDY